MISALSVCFNPFQFRCRYLMRLSFATITESPGAKSEERAYRDTSDAECT